MQHAQQKKHLNIVISTIDVKQIKTKHHSNIPVYKLKLLPPLSTYNPPQIGHPTAAKRWKAAL